MEQMDKCQVCGSANIRIVTGSEEYQYKGKKIVIGDFQKVVCDNCHEEVAAPKSLQKSMLILRDAQRTIDGLITSKEIRSIRKSFKMTQEQFGEILGGGEKGFARYETGRVLQSKPMDNLLRIIREYPETLTFLKNGIKCRDVPVNIPNEMVTYDPELEKESAVFNFVISNNNMRKVV